MNTKCRHEVIVLKKIKISTGGKRFNPKNEENDLMPLSNLFRKMFLISFYEFRYFVPCR